MKYSVVVPVYNCINELAACVRSIRRQTESQWELLLVDDGATDGSGALCDRLAEQDTRIRVFHKANGGASSARNIGLEHATGDYILFLDGDDKVEEDLLESVSSSLCIASPQLLIFGMAFEYFAESGELEKVNYLSTNHAGIFSTGTILSEFSDFFMDNALSSACNKVFSGCILRDTGLRFSEEMTLYEDLDFVLRYLPYCQQILCLDRPLYHYRLPAHTPHVNRRVLDLDKLQRNLELLIGSVLALNSTEASQRAADLCVQMFDLHLMSVSPSKKELPKIIAAIRESAALHALSKVGVTPSAFASKSWPMILRGSVYGLHASLQKRKLVRNLKQIVKPLLKTFGLYRE